MVAVAHEGDALVSPPANPEEWLTDVPAPTLVITAPDSPTPVREIARLLTGNGQRELRAVDGGGHMAPITKAAEVLAVVEQFLDTPVNRSTARGPRALAAV
jgi:pimeloyl-ACP methyl ester carboxylesterase